jgi:hypothetical protein
MQVLDMRTPTTAAQRPGQGRMAAADVGTTVARPAGGRLPRYSFAAGPNVLLDLDRCVVGIQNLAMIAPICRLFLVTT